jgi:DNA-binding LacI/PurR family transcriptional regulator
MAKKITLQDVASEAGVSPTTVSQALSNKGRVSPETVELIKKVSEQLGYNRKNGNSFKTVGLLFSIEKSWAYLWVFIRVFIEMLERNLQKYGIHLVIIPIHGDKHPEELLLQLKDLSTQALVTLHLEDEELLQYISSNGIPVLVVMNNKYQEKYLSVCNDDFQGAYDAVRYLIEKGHKKIAYLGTAHPATASMGNDRFIGARKAIEDSGYVLPDAWIVLFEDVEDLHTLEVELKRLLELPETPTALYCLHDYLAEKVYMVLGKLGIKIPDNISIITAGDSFDYSQFEVPQITTMRSQTEQMGLVAADMLNRLVNFDDISQRNMGIKIRQQLVERGSCQQLME